MLLIFKKEEVYEFIVNVNIYFNDLFIFLGVFYE